MSRCELRVSQTLPSNNSQYFTHRLSLQIKFSRFHSRLGGVNRSATIVLAYLMAREQWRLRQAYYWVKTRRKQISPHEGYWKQLQTLEMKLFGSLSLIMEEVGPTLQGACQEEEEMCHMSFIPTLLIVIFL